MATMKSCLMSLKCKAQTSHQRLFGAMLSSRSAISCYTRNFATVECSNVGSNYSLMYSHQPSTAKRYHSTVCTAASTTGSVPYTPDEGRQIEPKKGATTLLLLVALGLGLVAYLISVQNPRSVIGTVGNILNLLLYTVPLLTFQRIIRNKSTEEFSVVPYVAAFLNSVLYALYGSPLVSNGWENVHVFTINATGIIMETIFISFYFWFTTPKKKVKVVQIMAAVLTFCLAMVIMAVLLPNHHLRRTIVGSFGFFASVSMYGSPLVAVKRVIETKSVEYMPLNLSLFSFLTTAVWLIYGLLGKDILLASPNFIGAPLGILQLAVYFIYRNSKGLREHKVSDPTGPLVVPLTDLVPI